MVTLSDLVDVVPSDSLDEIQVGLKIANELEEEGILQIRLNTRWPGPAIIRQLDDARSLREQYVERLLNLAGRVTADTQSNGAVRRGEFRPGLYRQLRSQVSYASIVRKKYRRNGRYAISDPACYRDALNRQRWERLAANGS